MGQLQEAIQTLQMAMSLCAVKRTGSSAKRQSKRVELNSADCVSVFLELAEALWLNGEQVSVYRRKIVFFKHFFISLVHLLLIMCSLLVLQ